MPNFTLVLALFSLWLGGTMMGCTVPNELPVDAPFAQEDAAEQGPQLSRPGVECTENRECESDVCTEGVCCATVCQGACVSCKVSGSEGTCQPLPATSGPRTEGSCLAEAPSTCALNGKCDGVGGCGMWPDGTACGNPACSDAKVIGFAKCVAAVCTPLANTNCSPFLCSQTAKGAMCPSSCKTQADCDEGTCTGAFCVTAAKLGNGQPCDNAGRCASGICSGQVCCDVACDGVGRACNLAGTVGTCSATGV